MLRAIGRVAILIVALPFAIIGGIFRRPRKCTPEELASELQRFAAGTEAETDWDKLESVPLIDPRLEAIRQEAMSVSLPLRAEDRAKLGGLASKARELRS